MSLRLGLTIVSVGLLAVTAGCGGDPGPSGSADDRPPASGPALSDTSPPTLPTPQRPPKRPTDEIRGVWLTGTVTRGGSGPCYGFRDEGGHQYALYSNRELDLPEGTRVRVRVAALELRIHCGPGEHLRVYEVQPA
jgi:hypothetical protein